MKPYGYLDKVFRGVTIRVVLSLIDKTINEYTQILLKIKDLWTLIITTYSFRILNKNKKHRIRVFARKRT